MVKNVIVACGVGQTGKTEVISRLAEAKGWIFIPSVTREFYKLEGISTEEQFKQMVPQQAFAFQFRILEYYINNFTKIVAGNQDKTLIFDRSPIDHVAYTISAMIQTPESVSIEEINRLVEKIIPIFEHIKRIFYFPYPVSWSDNSPGSDGFRYSWPLTNFILDALTMKIMNSVLERLENTISLYTVPDLSIEERVKTIIWFNL